MKSMCRSVARSDSHAFHVHPPISVTILSIYPSSMSGIPLPPPRERSPRCVLSCSAGSVPTCAFSLIHPLAGSRVPHRYLPRTHAASTPDAAWAKYLGFFPMPILGIDPNPGFDDRLRGFRCFIVRFAFVHLSLAHLPAFLRTFPVSLTTKAFDLSSIQAV